MTGRASAVRWKSGAAGLVVLIVGFFLGRIPNSNLDHPTPNLDQYTPPPPIVSAPEMVAAFEAALDDTNLLTRMRRFADAVDGLSPQTLDESLALLVENRLTVNPAEVDAFMLAWGRFDPAGALAWARTGPAVWRKTLKLGAIYAWGYHDAPGAVEAIAELGVPEQHFLRASLVKGWARSGDNRGVTDYVFSLEATKKRMPVVRTLITEISRDGIESTIAWADAIPAEAPNAAREVAFTGVLRVVTQHDAERAARWFELSQTAPYAARAVQAMAPVWVDALDPPVFFAWVETLTPGETRDAGMRAGFTRWWKNDAESAAAWIQAAELSAAHDPAIDVYAQQISRASPELASEWVYRIHDETLRARAIRPVLRIWLHRDPEALRDWMNANDVPPEVRESIERTPRYQRMERGIEEPQIQRGGRRGEVRPRGQGRRSPTQRAENGSEPDASKGTSP